MKFLFVGYKLFLSHQNRGKKEQNPIRILYLRFSPSRPIIMHILMIARIWPDPYFSSIALVIRK